MQAAVGPALPQIVDTRDETSVVHAVNEFWGIDILLETARAIIDFTKAVDTEMKSNDLMYDINGSGTILWWV